MRVQVPLEVPTNKKEKDIIPNWTKLQKWIGSLRQVSFDVEKGMDQIQRAPQAMEGHPKLFATDNKKLGNVSCVAADQ